MKKHKRVTYTLKKYVIDLLNDYHKVHKIPKSKIVSKSIMSTLDILKDEENDLDYIDDKFKIKKLSDTTQMTFTIPNNLLDELNFHCEKLNMKKSHLVGYCIYTSLLKT